MTTSAEILFEDARKTLLREIDTPVGRMPCHDAFVAWLLPHHSHLPDLASLASSATVHLQNDRDYHHHAVIGFASYVGVATESAQQVLASGLLWLSGRPPRVDGTPMAFCTDAIALLGIALGTYTLADQSIYRAVAEWMSEFLAESHKMPGIQDWQRCLFAVVQRMVHAEPQLAMPVIPSVADIRVALYSKTLPLLDLSPTEQDEQQALSLLKAGDLSGLGLPRAALRVAAYDWIQRSAPVIIVHRGTAEDVVSLLRRVSAGLCEWTWEDKPRSRRSGAQPRKWHIDNEYHVQNILYFLLSPIFPDLKKEESFPSLGQKQPRTDLYIPSLKLIIEVKFIYPTTTFQDIIGEIAEDTGLYLARGSNYTGIIAFVWDDTRRTEQHSLLVQGLTAMDGIVDAVVVPRPGVMEYV